MSEELRDKNGLTEAEYLKDYNPNKWRKPSLTSDICIIARGEGDDKLLLIRRGNHPCIGKWALPGGFSEPPGQSAPPPGRPGGPGEAPFSAGPR